MTRKPPLHTLQSMHLSCSAYGRTLGKIIGYCLRLSEGQEVVTWIGLNRWAGPLPGSLNFVFPRMSVLLHSGKAQPKRHPDNPPRARQQCQDQKEGEGEEQETVEPVRDFEHETLVIDDGPLNLAGSKEPRRAMEPRKTRKTDSGGGAVLDPTGNPP